MDLRSKLLLGIGLAFIVAFTMVAVFSVISMQASYRALEDYEVRHAVGTTMSAMETDMKNTYSTARDYSAWTATYRFAQGENPGWIEENMGEDFFSRFTLDHVLVFDRTGRLLFSMQYNTSSREIEPVPETLATEIRNLSEAEGILARENGSYGILDTADGPLLIASHPILTDTYEGPAAGSVHIARRLDDNYLTALSAREEYAIAILPSRELRGNASLTGVVSQFASGSPVAIQADNGDQVSGYVLLGDLTSSGKYYLRVTMPRTIYTTGQANIAVFLTTLAGAGVFIILFVLLFVDRIILSRLNAITRAVRERKTAGNIPASATPNGGDELTRLALTIDPVFAQLAESRDKLSESEERYRTLAESARDLIYIIGRDDTVLYVNTFAAQAMGRSREEITGKPRSALFPGSEGERQRENIEKVLSTGLPVKIESNIPLADGESWQDTLLVPIRDRNGAISGVMGISRDITQRKRTEEALQASSERFRTVMDSLDALVYVADMENYEILFLNKVGQRVWGDASGRKCWDTIQNGQAGPCPFCTNDKLLDAGGKPTGILVWEFRNTVNGRWYECRDRAIEWTDGRFVRLEIATDITERKRAEEALFRVNEKLNLLSSITRHDILNQLTALAAYLDLSLVHVDNETLRDFISKEQKIAAIIDREISFTRDYQDLGVRAPVWRNAGETIELAGSSLLPRSVKIEVGFSDIEVFADPLLEKVFFNLIDNALRYGGEGLSVIRFSARTEGTSLVISCEDDGVGVPEEDKKHIFERGFGHHTGLGLFLSREILGITDITIAETGTFGNGARFEITLPKGTYRFRGGNRTG
jgi:PAS domain S-box-containing protein